MEGALNAVLRALAGLLLAFVLAACVAVQPPAGEKRIALTFDDIPRDAGAFLDRNERPAMLRAALREAGVEQAAFFINPASLNRHPEGVAQILAYAADGHVLANHSNTHPALSQTSAADYIADIDVAESWLSQLEGHRPWFRYPYLDEGRNDDAKRDAVRVALAERGLLNGYVTVDASDWFYEQAASDAVAAGAAINRDALGDLYVESHVEAAEFYDELARRTLGRSPAHVLLLHETDLAALYIGDLVAALRAHGWTIISADEAFADPIAPLASTYDTPSAQGALIEQLAWERGIPAPRWYARNDTNLARTQFDRRVLGIVPVTAGGD